MASTVAFLSVTPVPACAAADCRGGCCECGIIFLGVSNMDREEFLPENLRTLCERAGTVSDMCRKIGINRQQFNKYLAGTHAPSKSNLRAIASFFGLSEDVLFSSPSDFRSM